MVARYCIVFAGTFCLDMIIDPEVVLQFADREKMTKIVIGGSQIITG